MRCKYNDGWGKEWSEKVVPLSWKKCPGNVDKDNKYSVDGRNPRVATKINGYNLCTIIGNTHIPLNKVTSWNIKIHKSYNNSGGHIYIGIAPSNINQNDGNNPFDCGWYFDCGWSTLNSGPPHKYRGKEYGPRKDWGQYVHTGDSVGVVVNTIKGELSFALNGVNRGAAYCGIPLDKPLVPCVLLYFKGDSVEFDPYEVKETKVYSSIPVPFNISAKNIAWDSVTLAWDEVEGASFYQIEADGSKSWDAPTANTFTKRGLLPESEHSFRVRTVRGSSVSEWSSVMKARTLKWECVWKTCPDCVDDGRKYSVDERNPRVATMDGSDWCTIIGNTPIPLNTVTSWNVKILKSEDNDGSDILIGIAPNYINQNVNNCGKYGWYFYCYCSTLYSGPPHKYRGKEYGPREKNGQYVRTGDSVGVVVDTKKGKVSFVLNEVDLGVAYEGVPLDKPLVPCVLLGYEGDSVELA